MAFTACSKLGATNRQLAGLFGVGHATLDRWMARHAEFRGAIKRGKEIFDTEVVEKALVRLACGYRYTERTKRFGDLAKVVHKEVPPNTTAHIFWLSNRAPGRWQRKAEGQHEVGGNLAERLVDAKKRVLSHTQHSIDL